MKQRDEIVIIGCGGHSRSVADVILASDPEANMVFVDDNAGENESVLGFSLVKKFPVLGQRCFVAIGDNAERKSMMLQLADKEIISVVSSKAHIGFQAKLGRGCFVANFCQVGPEASIGEGSIVNTGSVVEHEVQVGSYCHVGPNATISGRCKIGDLVFLGVGATIKNYISVCPEVVIGAGAVVVKDITEPGVYAGCPARRIR